MILRLPVLGRWYERIDTEDLLRTIPLKRNRQKVQAQIDKAAARTALEDDFPKLASVEDGKPRIKDNPPLIFHQARVGAGEYDRMVRAAFRKYRATLSDERRQLLDRYAIKDIAAKVVGVGSVGTRCGILR